jgi:uncharacterized membrane protein YoaK (UPF0700 family)
MPGSQHPGRLLFSTLLILTVVSGFVDAVSYLGLGHVFTANMTGNVVLLGFAAAGASGFSAPACLTSLGTFLAGAAAAGRIARQLGPWRHLLAVAMAAEAVVAGAAAVVAVLVSVASEGWRRFTIIALLAFGMGVRNSTIRRLAVPDLTTTVLTLTLTGLAADSPLAGGDGSGSVRRISAVAAMLAGALAGASAFLHAGMAPTLAIGAVVVAATGAAFWAAGESRRLDQAAS